MYTNDFMSSSAFIRNTTGVDDDVVECPSYCEDDRKGWNFENERWHRNIYIRATINASNVKLVLERSNDSSWIARERKRSTRKQRIHFLGASIRVICTSFLN